MPCATCNMIRGLLIAQGVSEPIADALMPIVEVTESAVVQKAVKTKRKASSYGVKYGKAFKKVAKLHMKKGGGWKKNGFKNAQKAAHKLAKGMKK